MESISLIIRNTCMITSFVLVMMLLIEYINVRTKGSWRNKLQGHPLRQILLAAVLGAIPGCLGGFAVVSLFSHGFLSFGALMACMIASFGDEAFVMFATVPVEATIITSALLLLGIVVGFIIHLVSKKNLSPFEPDCFPLHDHDHQQPNATDSDWKTNLRKPSFVRATLMVGIGIIITAILLGWFEHDHNHDTHDHSTHHAIHEQTTTTHIHHHVHEHEHTDACLHEHSDEIAYGDISALLLQERWMNILFVLVCCIALYIVIIVPEHFLNEHLWAHIIKGHLPRIFLWTLGVLSLIQIGQLFFDINTWIQGQPLIVLCLAILIGLIPESGPHVIFISLFAAGSIPLSILMANCIVQEGHAGLPLFAESKRSFIYMKGISVVLGGIVGLLGYGLGF